MTIYDDNAGIRLSEEAFPQIRARLIEEIHRRAYHDTGVEVLPDGYGDDGTRPYVARTPHCRQGDRRLALLCWVRGTWPGPARNTSFGTWCQLVADAFRVLAVDTWRTRQHRDCFHRRAKARYDLVFSVAVRLVAGAPSGGARFWAVDGRSWDDGGPSRSFRALAARYQESIPVDRPPRHLAVACCDEPIALLRTDGHAITRSGALALDRLWWQGNDLDLLAHEVRTAAGHTHPKPLTRVRSPWA